jgi:hypothetical protein
MDPYTPGQSWSVDWIVFGGNWQATTYTPAKDFSLRVTLTLSASSPPVHTFGEWVVESMPGEVCPGFWHAQVHTNMHRYGYVHRHRYRYTYVLKTEASNPEC